MCGIFFSLSKEDHLAPNEELLDALRERGPDSMGLGSRTVTVQPTTSASTLAESRFLTFVSTVLSLRGNSIINQPLEDPDSGSLLCWNGEAWKIDNALVQGNDAKAVFDLLLQASQSCSTYSQDGSSSPEHGIQNVLQAIGSLTGPYAFVFYDARCRRVFYGRDALGRRSLVIKRYGAGSLVISSVPDATETDGWDEVEADGVYMLDFEGNEASHIPWTVGDQPFGLPYSLRYPFPNLNKDDNKPLNQTLTPDSPAVSQLHQHLQASLAIRTQNIPTPPSTEASPARIAILFSGGLDCTVLARIMHTILPPSQPIDLLNVAFENPRVISAAAALNSQTTPPTPSPSPYALCPDRITGLTSHAELLATCPTRTWRFISINIPYHLTLLHRPHIISLIHPHSTEMDLSIALALYFAARGSGTTTTTTVLKDPLTNTNTETQTERHETPYTTPARVLISGLGADELFAGYTRHTTAFSRKDYPGLLDELDLDFKRLGKRNLGRDDRVISHWGKEVRYPYLDEDVVKWALRTPVWEKCGFDKMKGEVEGGRGGVGVGEVGEEKGKGKGLEPGKKVLRLLAWNLGMKGVAGEKKRAIQFGARTAKMEGGRRRGTDGVV